MPIYWVSKWVDYSDKYGLGYQLCDNSVGVLFNDSTRVILTSNGEYVCHMQFTLATVLSSVLHSTSKLSVLDSSVHLLHQLIRCVCW